MATRKTTSRTGKTSRTRQRPQASRKRLVPRKQPRGIDPAEIRLPLDSPEIAELAEEVTGRGGAVLGAYCEPLAGHPILLATLPLKAVEPTPFQRDLSPTHAKRLAQKIEESGSFLDPLIVVRGEKGELWTPNGRHRLAAARVLGLRQVTALVSPDEELAFRILALNTEKAHNLKDRSLEAIRMARELARRHPRAKEIDHAAELEGPELLTLGIIYEKDKRFAGGAYAPFLKKIDRFGEGTLAAGLRRREGYAARLVEIDSRVRDIVRKLEARGFRSPYLRTYVVARINPVRFKRPAKGQSGPVMEISEALTRMAAAARKFDIGSVKRQELALVAAVSSET